MRGSHNLADGWDEVVADPAVAPDSSRLRLAERAFERKSGQKYAARSRFAHRKGAQLRNGMHRRGNGAPA